MKTGIYKQLKKINAICYQIPRPLWAFTSPSPPWSCCQWSASSAEWCQSGDRTPRWACPPDGTRSPENQFKQSIRSTKTVMDVLGVGYSGGWWYLRGPGRHFHPSAGTPVWKQHLRKDEAYAAFLPPAGSSGEWQVKLSGCPVAVRETWHSAAWVAMSEITPICCIVHYINPPPCSDCLTSVPCMHLV